MEPITIYSFEEARKLIRRIEEEILGQENRHLIPIIGRKVRIFVEFKEPIMKGFGGGVGGRKEIRTIVGILEEVNADNIKLKLDPEIEMVHSDTPFTYEKEKIQKIELI